VAELAWWELFQDETLQGLIRTALEENKDLRLAVARVAQARAQLGETRAARFPEVTGGARGGRERVSQRAHRPLPNGVDAKSSRPMPGSARREPRSFRRSASPACLASRASRSRTSSRVPRASGVSGRR
jgi:outer membrane protein TolC